MNAKREERIVIVNNNIFESKICSVVTRNHSKACIRGPCIRDSVAFRPLSPFHSSRWTRRVEADKNEMYVSRVDVLRTAWDLIRACVADFFHSFPFNVCDIYMVFSSFAPRPLFTLRFLGSSEIHYLTEQACCISERIRSEIIKCLSLFQSARAHCQRTIRFEPFNIIFLSTIT